MATDVADGQDLEGGDAAKGGLGRFVRTWRGPLATVLIIVVWWELIARSGMFPEFFIPTLAALWESFTRLATTGILLDNTVASIIRLFLGVCIAAVLGIALGTLMGRFRILEEFFLPLITLLLPIPALAWIPLFMLWFGLGNNATMALVIFSSTLPIALNTWTGYKTVDSNLLRAAQIMNVHGFDWFRKVVVPGGLPMTLTGLRLGLAQGWRAVIAGEFVAFADAGLGVLLFNARQFVDIGVMLSTLLVIGVVSQFFERMLFGNVERVTTHRWGMTRDSVGQGNTIVT